MDISGEFLELFPPVRAAEKVEVPLAAQPTLWVSLACGGRQGRGREKALPAVVQSFFTPEWNTLRRYSMANMSRRTMIKAIGAARLKEDVTCLKSPS